MNVSGLATMAFL